MDIKKEIHQKVSNINDNITSNLIYTFIRENNIIYSENQNGIFFNISLLDDKLSHEFLYYINKIVIKNENKLEDKINIPKTEFKVKKKKRIKKPIYKNYNPSDLELIILNFSF